MLQFFLRQNHSEIEKRRRDKLNTYIRELGQLLSVGTSRKLDKLTVLRIATQQMRHLGGSFNAYSKMQYKPRFISDTELKELIFHVSNCFFYVLCQYHYHCIFY